MKNKLPISAETFVWALQASCQLHRVPCSPELALREFPPPYHSHNLLQLLQAHGLKCRWRSVHGGNLEKMALPCFVTIGPDAAAEDGAPHGMLLLVKVENGSALYFEPGNLQPLNAPLTEFAQRCSGHALLIGAPKAEKENTARKFGFAWFVPELMKHKAIWRDVLLASLALQLMALATPLFTQVVIDKVVVHHTANTLVVIGVGMILFMLFSAAMSWVRQYLVTHTGNRIDAVLGLQLFEHLFRLPLRYFEHRATGTLVARFQGMESIREFLSGAAVTLILDVPFLLVFLAVMFYYSWLLTLVTLVVLGAIVVLSVAVTPLLRQRLNHQFLIGARNQAFVTEYIAGMETVKSLQMEPQLRGRYGDYLADYLHANFNLRQLSNTYNTLAGMLEQLMVLAILCLGAWLVMDGTDFTIGMLVAFQMFASRLSQPVLRMVGLYQQFQQASIAVKRLGDVMNAPQEPYSLQPAREQGGRGKIEFRNLSFRYAENLPFLYRNFDLAIEPGQCVALMGPSGSGKSTLAKLLQGFYLPNDGAITLDGRDIRHFSANELRQYYGVVPQETILFSGTLYDNLTFANPHVSFEQVVNACKLAEIHDAIEQLPEGYQTKIGERGAGLSGGQRQRIAIARALLKRPKILVFDEATSNLDHSTAEHFAATINQLKGKVTMLFITHQLPKGLKVDEVMMLGAPGEPDKRMSVVSSDKKPDEAGESKK